MLDIITKGKCISIFLIAAVASACFATPIPSINIAWNEGSWQSDFSESDINSGFEGQFNVAKNLQNASISTHAEIQFDTGAFILLNLTARNVSSVTQTYNFSFDVPVDPAYINGTVYGGSTAGSITDNGAYAPLAAVTTVAEKPFYEGKIDGSTVLGIYDTATSWAALWNGGSTNINAVNEGLPGPFLSGPAALNTIGIDHNFTLTPGDVIAVTSYFQINPEPATLGILGLGSLILIRMRRR